MSATFLEIVLVGAMCVGKSTIGRLLAARLGLAYRSTDAMWGAGVPTLGFDAARAEGFWARGDHRALYEYGKPFEVALLESLAVEPGVLEVGCTFTVQEDTALANRCTSALRRHPNVVHLVASLDAEEHERILFARLLARSGGQTPEEPELWMWQRSVRQRIAAQVAAHTVSTKDRRPEEVVEAIIGVVGGIR